MVAISMPREMRVPFVTAMSWPRTGTRFASEPEGEPILFDPAHDGLETARRNCAAAPTRTSPLPSVQEQKRLRL